MAAHLNSNEQFCGQCFVLAEHFVTDLNVTQLIRTEDCNCQFYKHARTENDLLTDAVYGQMLAGLPGP